MSKYGPDISEKGYISVNKYSCIHVYNMYICKYICMCINVCIYVNIYIYMHIYIYIYIYIYINITYMLGEILRVLTQ